ncbi:MAG TPA: D-2-hydroxyacid dehydrogenase [Terriglobales bacterium]|jgi:phosphoglycerate dehydrogenase-like enzyme
MRVVIATKSRGSVAVWRWPDAATARLRAEFPQVDFVEYSGPADAAPATPQEQATASAVFTTAAAVVAWQLDPALLAAAPQLRWIHSPAAAVNQLLSPELIARPIAVTNAASVHATVVAEHTAALLLALARGLPAAVRQQTEGRWDIAAWPDIVADVAGTSALLLGMGHIGRALAVRLAAFDIRVVGVRRGLGGVLPAGCAAMHTLADLPRLLPEADWIILALPNTAETQTVIGAPQFALMRPSARLLSVGRGAALDEAALARALASGTLAGAGLDVFRHEPLPASSPLWRSPRMLITPHVGASSPGAWDRQVALLEHHLRRFLAGATPEPLVDKHLGY